MHTDIFITGLLYLVYYCVVYIVVVSLSAVIHKKKSGCKQPDLKGVIKSSYCSTT